MCVKSSRRKLITDLVSSNCSSASGFLSRLWVRLFEIAVVDPREHAELTPSANETLEKATNGDTIWLLNHSKHIHGRHL